ncbi:MAG: hypothetical protein H6734_23095, partial [Alphaproteobacteria bacterium]|nr:hypothetical protein [Alphaproteobacteria bacterium]
MFLAALVATASASVPADLEWTPAASLPSGVERLAARVAGLPVLDRSVGVDVDEAAPVGAFTGSTVPAVDADVAVRLSGLTDATAELAVSSSLDRLVWAVDGRDAAGRPVQAWLDAANGEVVRWIPRSRSVVGHAFHDAFGTVGKVGLHTTEADLLVADGLDVYSTHIEGGERVEVAMATPDDDGAFAFPSDDPAFAEVNAFFWAQTALEDMEARFGVGLDHPLELSVNERAADGTLAQGVAWIVGDVDHYRIELGGMGAANFAHDPSVVVHETMHGVLADHAGIGDVAEYPIFQDPIGLNTAPGALNEGLADYFAASLLDDPQSGRV